MHATTPTRAARWAVGMLASLTVILDATHITPRHLDELLTPQQGNAFLASASFPVLELITAGAATAAPLLMTLALAIRLTQAAQGATSASAPLFPAATATAVLGAAVAVFTGALHPLLAITILLIWTAATAGLAAMNDPAQTFAPALRWELTRLALAALRLPAAAATVLLSDAPSTAALTRYTAHTLAGTISTPAAVISHNHHGHQARRAD
jgi:hypothetical protein